MAQLPPPPVLLGGRPGRRPGPRGQDPPAVAPDPVGADQEARGGPRGGAVREARAQAGPDRDRQGGLPLCQRDLWAGQRDAGGAARPAPGGAAAPGGRHQRRAAQAAGASPAGAGAGRGAGADPGVPRGSLRPAAGRSRRPRARRGAGRRPGAAGRRGARLQPPPGRVRGGRAGVPGAGPWAQARLPQEPRSGAGAAAARGLAAAPRAERVVRAPPAHPAGGGRGRGLGAAQGVRRRRPGRGVHPGGDRARGQPALRPGRAGRGGRRPRPLLRHHRRAQAGPPVGGRDPRREGRAVRWSACHRHCRATPQLRASITAVCANCIAVQYEPSASRRSRRSPVRWVSAIW